MAWMAYLLAVSALFAVAARVAESLLSLYGRPVRYAWLLALAGPLLVPWIAPRASAPVSPVRTAEASAIVADASLLTQIRSTPGIEVVLERVWLVSTALALLVLAGWFTALAVAPRRWPRRRVDEEDVRVSDTAGPAVFGVLLPSIVVPAWLLECPADVRRLALLHEREHIAARDPALLAAGAFLVALTPWNPVAWWLLLRLRSAVELDCDRRVLRRGASVRAYGSMLLGVAGRGTAPLAAVALVEPAVLLERRIVAMTRKPIRRRAARAVGLLTITGLAVLAACRMDAPTSPVPAEPAADVSPDATTDAQLAGYVERVTKVVAALKEAYGVEGTEIVELKTDDQRGQLQALELELRTLKERVDGDADVQGRHTAVLREKIQVERVDPATEGAGVLEGRFEPSRKDASAAAVIEGSVRLRSLAASGADPIYLVDGERVSGTVLKGISPDRIERIEVTKGAAAARIVGPEAANGVVSIFLKKSGS